MNRNAAGIKEAEFARAFRPAEIPADTSGLCEFGMGMKSAACWFAQRWSVRTSALGEAVERTIAFDINRIVEDRTEELEISTRSADPNAHYTEIVLSDLCHPPQRRTIGKIKDHVGSIYRVFLRQRILEIKYNDEIITYEEPEVLSAPSYRNLTGPSVLWRKEIDFDFGMGQRAKGFAALRARASTSLAGFALFRRQRLIQGSADETYRPEYIFKKPNSFRFQRLFGELHLEGFEISHTKDGFRWDENEEVFLRILEESLSSEPLNLLDQADRYSYRGSPQEIRESAQRATERTAAVVQQEVPPILERQLNDVPSETRLPTDLPEGQYQASNREIDVE